MTTPGSSRAQLTLHTCPQCGNPAEEQWRRGRGSGPRSAALIKTVCVQRHWFLLPDEQLESGTDEAESA
jgi:hypothetical protein